MNFEEIDLTVKGNTAVLKLNRPKVMNALSRKLVDEIDEAIESIAKDPNIRALVICGADHFAAGADIKEMIEMNPEEAKNFGFISTFTKIENLTKPTIAALSGYALGGGLELALVCDLRIAGPNAKFGLPEINLGIIPGAGGTQRLPRLIGISRAKELILQGIIINADKALQYGLVNEIADDPIEAAVKLADKLASKPAVAVKMAKQCINATTKIDLKSGLEFEEIGWSSLYATEDQKEGMRAFAEKRKPNFKGK